MNQTPVGTRNDGYTITSAVRMHSEGVGNPDFFHEDYWVVLGHDDDGVMVWAKAATMHNHGLHECCASPLSRFEYEQPYGFASGFELIYFLDNQVLAWVYDERDKCVFGFPFRPDEHFVSGEESKVVFTSG